MKSMAKVAQKRQVLRNEDVVRGQRLCQVEQKPVCILTHRVRRVAIDQTNGSGVNLIAHVENVETRMRCKSGHRPSFFQMISCGENVAL